MDAGIKNTTRRRNAIVNTRYSTAKRKKNRSKERECERERDREKLQNGED